MAINRIPSRPESIGEGAGAGGGVSRTDASFDRRRPQPARYDLPFGVKG
jgi:hypothetical protein